jgi:hypothetical protein
MKSLYILFLTAGLCNAQSVFESAVEYHTRAAYGASQGVALICELKSGEDRKQWLLLLRDSSLAVKAGESSRSGIIAKFQRTLHSSTGHDYSFPDVPFAIDVEMVGPFTSTGSNPVLHRDRAIGNKLYFSGGAFQTALIYDRVLREGHAIPDLALLLRATYSKERMARDQAAMLASGLTDEDEKEIARSAFALNQFGLIAGKMPAFRDIMEAVMDVPTVFKGIYINIDWSKLERSPGTAGAVGDQFIAPIQLVTATRLSGRVSIVKPQSNLIFCAGIRELWFDRSEKSPGTSLHIWIYETGSGAKK